MMPNSRRSWALPLLATGVLCVVVMSAVLPALAHPAALPPRPTKPAAKRAPAGATIELRVQFPETWPWEEAHWQEVWTVVQWQDGWGDWHDVEGWRGNLDRLEEHAGAYEGRKAWWLSGDLFGKGPFRWQVFRHEGGTLVAQSEPFDLPDATSETLLIETAMQP
jgi:hypothetical protein